MANRIRQLSSDLPIHITARSNNREQFPIPIDEVFEILESYLFLISKAYFLEIISFVLMPNHFHLMVRDPKLNLPTAMNYFMRETAKEINRCADRINRMWGGPYHSSVITSLNYYYACYRYVYRNPVVARLSEDTLSYPYSSLGVLLGERKSILPLVEDLTLFSSVEQTTKWLEDCSSDKHRDEIRKSLRHPVMTFSPDRRSRKIYCPEVPLFL